LQDLAGGVFSLIQLIIDAVFIDHHPWGIISNPVKLGLAFQSMAFDTIFILQKFWWFPDDRQKKLPKHDGREEL
jgi:cystinosin